jgi:hypothetical protein
MNPSRPLKTRLSPPRLSGWLLITLVLLVCVWAIAPQQLPVSLYKLSLVTLAAVVGYWLDRSLFPYARPDFFLALDDTVADGVEVIDPVGPDEFSLVQSCTVDDSLARLMSAAMLRRAIIVGCAMLAMGLGA